MRSYAHWTCSERLLLSRPAGYSMENDPFVPSGGSVRFAGEAKNRFGNEIVNLRLEP
jgi:hypothetical protein